MIWLVIAAVLAVVGYVAWKSTEAPSTTFKFSGAPESPSQEVADVVTPVQGIPQELKAMETPSEEEPVKKVRKKYGGKVKKKK